MYTINDLYDLDHTLAADYLKQFTYPWEALKGIKDLILELGPKLGPEYKEISEHVWVHETAKVFPSAYLGAPCIIGPNTEVRHGAFIRSSALVVLQSHGCRKHNKQCEERQKAGCCSQRYRAA